MSEKYPFGEHVLIRLTRPEGAEDIHPELLLEDLRIAPEYKPEVVDPVAGVGLPSDAVGATGKEEREAFEAWFEADAYHLEHSNWFRKDADDDYEIDHVGWAWSGWQARAALAAPDSGGQSEALALADKLDEYATGDEFQRPTEQAAAELRRLHTALASHGQSEPARSDDPSCLSDEEIDAVFNASHSFKEHPWVNWRRFARAILSRAGIGESIQAAHDYLRAALKLPEDAPRRFDYYAHLIEQRGIGESRRKPLADKEISRAFDAHDKDFSLVASAWSFEAGVRFAERQHGIVSTPGGSSNED